MNEEYKYDPEDLESLLLHKQFHELYPEEKAFVLKHMDSPEEYESMRQTLFELRNAASQGDWLQPDASIKKALLAEFASEKKGSFRVWLNALFARPQVSWYRQPALQLAFVVLVITTGVWLLVSNNSQQPSIAELNDNTPKEAISTASTQDTLEIQDHVFAENKMPHEFPIAPEPIQSVSVPQITAEEGEQHLLPPEEIAPQKAMAKEDNVHLIDTAPIVTAPPKAAAPATRNADKVLEEVSVEKLYKNETKTSINSKPISEVKDLLRFLYTAQ